MAEEEDLIVKLEAEPPAEGDKPEAKPPPVPGPSVSPQSAVQDLERQIEAERADRGRLMAENQRLEREREEAVQIAQRAEQQTGNNYMAWLDSQISNMSNEMDAMAAQAEACMNDGDFKSVSELNKRIGRVGGQLAIAEREKLAFEQQAKQPKQQPQQRKPQQQPRQQQAVPTDPIEKAIHGRSEPTKQFLRKHTDLIRSDGTLKASAINAHEKALDAGHTVDTPEYFGFIEQAIGAPAGDSANGATVQVPGYSAPVSRNAAPGGDNLSPGTFRMTPKMRRLAEEQGVTPAEWAANYIRLVKEGRMTPIT
jgi:hypothetical protein